MEEGSEEKRGKKEGKRRKREAKKKKKNRKFVFYLLGLAHTGNFQKHFRWKLLYLTGGARRKKGKLEGKMGKK